MGSFGAGLASIGGSLAQAQELARQQKLQDIQIELEKARLGTEQARQRTEERYADIYAQREKRLSADLNKPYNLQWKLSGNTMIVAGQNPDGSPFVKSFPVSQDIGYQLKALEDEINAAPPEAQPYLRALTNADIAEGNIQQAAKNVGMVMQQFAKQAGAPDTVRTGMQAIPIEINGQAYIVQVPTTTTTTKTPRTTLPVTIGGGGGGIIPQPETVSPISSGATDRPGAPQSSVTSPVSSPAAPNIPLPPGSRIIGVKPPPGSQKQKGLKEEMQAGLRVLHVSLFGSGSTPGLDSTVKVLDSDASRFKMVMAGVGTNPDPNQWKIRKLVEAGFYKFMTPDEKNYVYQLNRAVSAINALRSITGLPRSTQQLMDRYVLELPNPITTPSSKDARNQLQLIEREIQAAMETAANPGAVGGAGLNIPIPVAPPNVPGMTSDQSGALDRILGPKK